METNEWTTLPDAAINPLVFEYSIQNAIKHLCILLQQIENFGDDSTQDLHQHFRTISELISSFGFHLQELSMRLSLLYETPNSKIPIILMGFVGPDEDFDFVINGLRWDSLLFYASHFYQVDAGMLTDGKKIKMIHFIKSDKQQKKTTQTTSPNQQTNLIEIYKVISEIIEEKKKQQPDNQKTGRSKTGSREVSGRRLERQEFWGELLAMSKGKTDLFSNKKPSIESYLSTGSGKTGIGYTYIITSNEARVELYIDKGNGDWNKQVFDQLFADREQIEKDFQSPLVWDRLNDKRASVIRYQIEQSGIEDREGWSDLQKTMIEAMIRFENAFKPFIQRI